MLETLRVGSLPEGEGKRTSSKDSTGGGGGGGGALGYLVPALVLGFAVWFQFFGGADVLGLGAGPKA